jgi:Domain of unknown function (DUF4266)
MHWLCLAIVIAAPLCGCSSVRPWEREELARPEMAWEPDPLEASLESHIHFSKEAALVGGGSGGGGCGCN